MTLSAVATTYVFSAWCTSLVTGNHFFPSLPFPIAIFLASHLLFTDPSTSPRSEPGASCLACSTIGGVALYVLLDRLGLPTFYDKLLPVPLLNLSIRGIDHAARSDALKRFDPAALGRALTPRKRNLAYMAAWTGSS